MAEVISFQDVVRHRRRQRARELTRRCAALVELNLRREIELYDVAPEAERPVRARHIRKLSDLLGYIQALA